MQIVLPFPPADLSGHAKGKWQTHAPITKKHRGWAKDAALAAAPAVPATGDIHIHVTFYPPDRRSDRVNMPNRIKPYWDGIADALKVNDRRFLPSFAFAEPVEDARVVFTIGEGA